MRNNILLKTLFSLVYMAYNALCDLTNDTGWHLAGDRHAVLARRLFQIPHEDAGRDLEVSMVGNLQQDTWQKGNGQMSFPEVDQQYSWAKRSRAFPERDVYDNNQVYTMVKNDMGKYSWWRLNHGRYNGALDYGSVRNGVTDVNDQNDPTWNRVRARFDSLTGDCTHKMHYQHPYMIIICYNSDAIADTLNSPMVYDYYLNINRPGVDGGSNLLNNVDPATSWPISGQNYMNSTQYNAGAPDNPELYTLGHGPLTVDFNHRVHTTTIYAIRTNELTQNANGGQYWTTTWNGPYQGQMSNTARFPTNTWSGTGKANVPPSETHSRTHFFMRPHQDMRYLKMCNAALQISDLSYLIDIVQPRPQDVNQAIVYITYMASNWPTAGLSNHRVARCTLDQQAAGSTGINQDFRQSMPFSAGTQNFDVNCFTACTRLSMNYVATAGNAVTSQVFNSILEGGIKIVGNQNHLDTHDFIVFVDTNPPAAGTSHHTGRIVRCRIEFATGNIQNDSCDEDPICMERDNRNAFGYFSDCRTSNSCGVYYMGTVDQFGTKNLMNRVYCVDIINFNGNEDPIMYRRHITAVHAFDVNTYIQATIESETTSQTIRSYQEIVVFPNSMIAANAIDPTTSNWFVFWPNAGANNAQLWNRNPEPGPDFADTSTGAIDIIGRVTQAHLPNHIDDNYDMLGYFNHTYAMPLRRHHWKVNAPRIELLGAQVNQSYLLLGDVHMENTEDWTLHDQVPLGHHSLRVRHEYHGTGTRYLEVVKCNQKFNFTTLLNCTFMNQNINVNNHGVSLATNEHINRVWKFDESIVVMTNRPRSVLQNNVAGSANTILTRLMIFNKNTGTWSARDLTWSGYNNNQAVVEYIDCVEHEGDIHFVFKFNVYYATSNGEGATAGAYTADNRWITTPIRRARAYGLNLNDPLPAAANAAINGGWREIGITTPELNWRPNHHPTNGAGNLDHGWTNIRFHPLEDDACISGFNIVQDTSWRIRFLVDCNRRSKDSDQYDTRRRNLQTTNPFPINNEWGQGKWVGDHFLFDNSVTARYNTMWNVTLRNGEGSNTDFLGDDWEEGCATREHVFIFDREASNDGWVLAAVHMHHKSIRMFELQRWGVTGVKGVWCVGDNAVAHLSWSTGALPQENGDAIAVLYGTNLADARRRIHSMEKYPQAITSVMPTKFGDKIWIRGVMNQRPFYRVAWMDGPIVLMNSTRTQLTTNTFIRTTSGNNTFNDTPARVGFIWANNEVNMTNITRQLWTASTWDMDALTNISGHVYTVSTYGVNQNSITWTQRVNKEANGLTLNHGDYTTSTNDNRPWLDTATSPNDNRRRFYEMKYKKGRMMRLFYDRYYTRMTHYNRFDNALHGMNTGYECQHLDFAFRPGGTYYYWATVAVEAHYKHVRVWKHQDIGVATVIAGNSNGIRSLDWNGRIVHNDDIHKLTLDPVTDAIYVMTFYNENDRLLNISTFNFDAFVYNQLSAVHDDPTNVGHSPGNSNNYDDDINGPAFTELYTNISCHSVFETTGYTGVAFAPTNSGNVRIRWFDKTTGGASATALTNFFAVNTDMKRINHMDCANSNSNNAVHCIFIGPDRLFYQYEINYGTVADIPVVRKWVYRLYKDYEAKDIKLGSMYIVIKASSLDDNDNTVLTYKRQDLITKPGMGFMWGAFNGTKYADIEWDKAQVEHTDEFGNGHKFYVQQREDVGADIYDIGNLKATVVSDDWQKGKNNCIQFDRAENSKCVPVEDVWYRNVPNHPGPEEKHNPDNYNLWRILGWVAAGLIVLGAIALIIMLLKASPKPGMVKGQEAEYYDNVPNQRGSRVVEEVTTERASTRRGLNQYEDIERVQYSDNNAASQEELYGDYSSMPYRQSQIIYGSG